MPAATEGINAAMDGAFHGATTRYVGLIDNTGFVEIDSDDTMASHAGWTEATGYSSTTRPEWTEGASSSGVIVNASSVTFLFTAPTTIIGVFVCTNSDKGGTTGTLQTNSHWLFPTERSYNPGDSLPLTLALQGAM